MSESPKKCPLPVADGVTGLRVLRGLARDRSLLTALSLMHQHVGTAFQVTMPVFRPAVLIGPETNRQILVTERDKLRWRTESDPVTRLLRRGILVLDGDEHDAVRAHMDPPLHRHNVVPHIPDFWRYTDQVTQRWADGATQDMLVEMRRVALLILMGTLFKIDFAPDMDRLWPTILRLLEYIAPGLWIMWSDMPRPQYAAAIEEMDDYLYYIIRKRRAALADPTVVVEAGDLLGTLIRRPEMDDDLIRDQLLTMLIAGHDTSTALLAWALYLLGMHPETLAAVRAEVDRELPLDPPPTIEQVGRLDELDRVIKETLRLYPPIQVGNRAAGEDMRMQGYDVPAGTRVMYSIYLSHRNSAEWPEPERFCPARFDKREHPAPPAFAYVPFGGGPRNCIGAAFAQVEAKVVLARLVQTFDLTLLNGARVRPYMGATLEPRPGVKMRVRRR